MTARTSVMTGGSNSFQTSSEDLNAVATDFISDGIVGAVAATSGVAPMTGGLAVNAQGTPDRTTAITAGKAYVTATPTSQASQRLRVTIDAQNLTHATNTTGGTRYDWIYVQVSATLAANPVLAGDTTGTVVISRSTSSSTDNGTPPTYGYHIATVTLTNGYTTITNGTIADTRVRAGATYLIGEAGTTWTPTWTNLTVGNGTVVSSQQQIGKRVFAEYSLVFGSSSSVSGTLSFTLPVTSATLAVGTPIGTVFIDDNGVATYLGTVSWASTTTANFYVPNGAADTRLVLATTNKPIAAYGTGDSLRFHLSYPVA